MCAQGSGEWRCAKAFQYSKCAQRPILFSIILKFSSVLKSAAPGSAQTREREEHFAHAIEEEPQVRRCRMRENEKQEKNGGKQDCHWQNLVSRRVTASVHFCSALADTPSRLLGMGRVESNSSGKSFLKDSRLSLGSVSRKGCYMCSSLVHRGVKAAGDFQRLLCLRLRF